MFDDIEKQRDEWAAAMRAKGHKPIMNDDGRLDFFVRDNGFHNGPGCSDCGDAWCWHCTSSEDIDKCEGAPERPREMTAADIGLEDPTP